MKSISESARSIFLLLAAITRTSISVKAEVPGPNEALSLQYLQQFGLQAQRHLCDLIAERLCPFSPKIQLAILGPRLRGRANSLVPNSSFFRRSSGKCCTIHLFKFKSRTGGQSMDQAGDGFSGQPHSRPESTPARRSPPAGPLERGAFA